MSLTSKKVLLSPIESASIAQLVDIIRAKTDLSSLSEKEFNNMIMSRRPLELIIMAQAISIV
jgi:hypothetical protein